MNSNICLVYSAFDRHSKRSNKSHSRRRRQEEKHNLLRQFVIEQNALLRQQIGLQQLEINELKQQIEKFRWLAKKIDDEIEWVVYGVCGVQHHLEELDCHRRMEMAIKDKPLE